jgi:hypothetical protein
LPLTPLAYRPLGASAQRFVVYNASFIPTC